MKQIISIFFIITLLTNISYAKELNKNEVIEKMIEAYGGEKNLLQLDSYKQVWNVEFMNSDKSGFDKRTVKMPYELKTEIIYPDKTEIRILTKDSAKKIFTDKTKEVSGPMLDAMRLQLLRLYHPLELKRRVDDLKLTQNQKQHILALKSGKIAVEFIISKKDSLIEKVIGRLQMGPQQMEFLTKYEDYKLVNGVMVPHKEIKYVGSMNTAIMELKEIKFK